MNKISFFFSFLFLCSLILIIGCSTTSIKRQLSYEVQCKNCGTSSDGYLSFKVNKNVGKDSSLVISITNLKAEPIVFDERLFAMCYDNVLTEQPFGIRNPNIIYSWTNQFEENLKSETPNLYDVLFGNYNKYSSQVSRNYSATTTTVAQPFIILPPNSIWHYVANNYLFEQFQNQINKYSAWEYKELRVDLNKVKIGLEKYYEKPYKYTFIYKLLSEVNWRATTIILELEGIIIKEEEVKK